MSLDIRTTLLVQFSKQGPSGFVSNFMGNMWPKIQPFFNEERAWMAIDNAMALMSFAQLVVPKSDSAEDLWAESKVEDNSWMAKKLALVGAAPKHSPCP